MPPTNTKMKKVASPGAKVPFYASHEQVMDQDNAPGKAEDRAQSERGDHEPRPPVPGLHGHDASDALHGTSTAFLASGAVVRWTINCCNETGTTSRPSSWARLRSSAVPMTVADTRPPNS